MAKIKVGKKKPKSHPGDVGLLEEFVGFDLLDEVERISSVTMERETIEIVGKIMTVFTLRVTFNGARKH